MGSYVLGSLIEGERIEHSAYLSLWAYLFNFILGGIFLIVFVALTVVGLFFSRDLHSVSPFLLLLAINILPILLIVIPLWARRTTELAITSNRLISKHGIFSTHAIEIRLERIESVRVNQSLLGKLLNYGDILVTGTGTTFDPIPKIANPMAFRIALNNSMETRSRNSN